MQMGPVGAAIFRAWLLEARMLYSSPEEAQVFLVACVRTRARERASDRMCVHVYMCVFV